MKIYKRYTKIHKQTTMDKGSVLRSVVQTKETGIRYIV